MSGYTVDGSNSASVTASLPMCSVHGSTLAHISSSICTAHVEGCSSSSRLGRDPSVISLAAVPVVTMRGLSRTAFFFVFSKFIFLSEASFRIARGVHNKTGKPMLLAACACRFSNMVDCAVNHKK